MLSFIVNKWTETINHWRDYPLRDGLLWMRRYRIEGFLGMGSYGQAYRCTDLETGTTILLKRNQPSKKVLGRLLLERESRILKELSHPQIPKWIRYEKHGRDEGLLMELMEGYDLEHRTMVHGDTYTLQQSLSILKDLMQPLKHLHQAGFVHRDIRIPNVLERHGRMYLIDFGLACRIGERLPAAIREGLKETHSSEHEPGHADNGSWSAVKRRMRQPYPASDLYGLGYLFLFMMYAGYKPYPGQEERCWEEELGLSAEVKYFVSRLLQQEEASWQSAAECEQDLDLLLASFT